MKKYLLIFSVLMCYHFSSTAQILNVERDRLEAHDSGSVWLGNLGLGFNLQQQQTRILTWSNSLNLAYITPKNKLMFIGNYENMNGEGEVLAQNGYFHTRLNLGWKNKVIYELFTQAQFDQVRGINQRFLAGGALRYQPLGYDHKSITFAIAPGLMYEYENWSFGEQDSITSVIKTSSYLNLHTSISENIEFNMVGYYQARLSHLHQPRLSSDIALNFKVTKNLTLGTQFSILYDFAPVVPTDQLIYTWDNVLSFTIERRSKHKKPQTD